MQPEQRRFYCDQCQDIGLIPTERGSRPCPCQIERANQIRLKRAGIPDMFSACTLENFQPDTHTSWAHGTARRFVKEFFPGKSEIRGLLFTGNVGAGKTHLATGILRALIETKGIEGRFVMVPDLLDKLRNSYGQENGPTQAQILDPILAADLIVIDELGAARPTDWVQETIELLIGSLYLKTSAVIVTTNFPNLAPGGGQQVNEYARAMRPETLGDRIGARIYSRLQQMCTAVDMHGAPDWRQKK